MGDLIFLRHDHGHKCAKHLCEKKFPAPDPYRIAAEFPDKWRAYLRARFRGHMDVARAFSVSEAAARKWWAGEGVMWRLPWRSMPTPSRRCSMWRSDLPRPGMCSFPGLPAAAMGVPASRRLFQRGFR